jgi:succinate dehydrogenase/fumarate reductase flavoprotein subunit
MRDPRSRFDRTTDVLIVGSGAAGLVASLTADDEGLSTLVVEKGDKVRGLLFLLVRWLVDP